MMNRVPIFTAAVVSSLLLYGDAHASSHHIAGSKDSAALPGEPLEGLEARLDNGRDLLRSINSFDTGILDFEEVLVDEAFRREDALGYEARGSADAASAKMRQCSAECALIDGVSCQELISTSNIEAAFCAIDRADCTIDCLEDLLQDVQEIEISRSNRYVDKEEEALERERQIAILIVQMQALSQAGNAASRGVIGMQSVALKELIRLNLDDYSEYGVPEGETRNTTAARDFVRCTEQNLHETADCFEDANTAPREPTLLLDFLVFWGRYVACEFVAQRRQIGCAAEASERAGRAAAE